MTVRLIKIKKNKIILNKKGNIIKFIDKKTKGFRGFGEIYFSEIKKNKTKGWNIHYKFFSILSVPYGKVEFVFFDPEKKIKKFKKIISSKNENLSIFVPPKIWYSFKSKTKISMVVNVLNQIHDPKETGKAEIVNGVKIKN